MYVCMCVCVCVYIYIGRFIMFSVITNIYKQREHYIGWHKKNACFSNTTHFKKCSFLLPISKTCVLFTTHLKNTPSFCATLYTYIYIYTSWCLVDSCVRLWHTLQSSYIKLCVMEPLHKVGSVCTEITVVAYNCTIEVLKSLFLFSSCLL
jgi:hypothetical protein